MRLDNLQRSLAQLVREGAITERTADPATADYLRTVATTTGLRVMRDVVREWRQLLLRQGCPLTTGALLAECRFAASVEKFMRAESLDPLAQNLVTRFLAWVANCRDDDVKSLAQFEHALINVRRGINSKIVVPWKCHPLDAVAAALHARPMPKPYLHAIYLTEIAAHLPGGFSISEISAAIEPSPPQPMNRMSV